MKAFAVGNRKIGKDYPPFIIAEIGINHEGEYNKAIQMIDAAIRAGADCVKFQCHITEAETDDTTCGSIASESILNSSIYCLPTKRRRYVKRHLSSA